MDIGSLEVTLEGQSYAIQYEFRRRDDGWIDLTVWHDGERVSERVPGYQLDPHEDIREAHAVVLLRQLLSR